MKPLTVAVVGHVDHGKTLLVHALTGVDTDTLKEEKARGLSISLGFAGFSRDDCTIHLIDTPGHRDFTRMTASGLSGASAILLVISARDGIQNQTIEHVRLAHFFGIKYAIVALTKMDLIDGANTSRLHSEIAALLSKFELQNVEFIPVSARTKAGVKPLLSALTSLRNIAAQPSDLKGFFLPVDRAFSAEGAGTIITGTLLGGPLHADDAVHLLPSGKTTTVRGLQMGGVPIQTASAGARVAVNLRTTEVSDIRKGDVLCEPNRFRSAKRFDVRLNSRIGLKHMQHVTVLCGTSHAAGRIRLYPSGEETHAYAQLEFEKTQVAYLGQRFALQEPSSAQTLAGGVILDPNAPPMPRNKAAQIAILQTIERGGAIQIAHKIADRDSGLIDVPTLSRLSQTPHELEDEFEALTASTLIRLKDREALQEQTLSVLSDMHDQRPCRPFVEVKEVYQALHPAPLEMIAAACDRLIQTEQIRAWETKLALAHHQPRSNMSTRQRARFDEIQARAKAFGLRPRILIEPPSSEDMDLIDCLYCEGRLVRLYNHSLKQLIVLHADVIENAGKLLAEAFPDAQRFTTSMARETLDTNRKTIVPLLEYFDQTGLTTRIGNERTIVSNSHEGHT